MKHLLTPQEQWVTRLALLTAAGREPITMAHIREYGDMLTREIPLSALTDASREHIAANCERGFFPPWPILKAGLLAWQRDHPTQLRIGSAVPGSFLAALEELRIARAEQAARDRENRASWSGESISNTVSNLAASFPDSPIKTALLDMGASARKCFVET